MDFEGYTSEGDRKNRDILYVDLLWFAYEWEYVKCNSVVICHLKNGHEIILTLDMEC